MDPARTTAQPSADSPAPLAPGDAAGGGPRKRRVRNFLLDTGLQLRLASYLVAVATALSAGLGWLLWRAYRETSRVIALGDPDAGESIAQALASEDRWRIVLVAGTLCVVLVCLLAAAVVITHRIAGPAYAIGRTARAVRDGGLPRPRPLRSRDLLVDLADDVAGMVEALRQREDSERAVVERALASLRDPAAKPAERTSAISQLERLASDKEARLRS